MLVPTTWPKATVIIPNWNTRRWLPGCLGGLREQRFQDFRVILVDNGSTDDSVAFVRQHYPEVQILSLAKNRGFARAVNVGIGRTCSEYVALLNVDTEPQPNWLASLVETLEQSPPAVGYVVPRMLVLGDPKMVDNAGMILSWYGSAYKRGQDRPAEDYTQLEEVLWGSAGAALYRRAFFEDVGIFDGGFVSYFEDADLGIRGRLLGYRCLFVPTAEVLHEGHGAGIAQWRHVYLSTRNRLALLAKNIPLNLLFRHSWTLLFGQIYFFLAYKRPLCSLAGFISFLVGLPSILRQRHIIQKRRRISYQALEEMLSSDLGEPKLRDMVRAKLGWDSRRNEGVD